MKTKILLIGLLLIFSFQLLTFNCFGQAAINSTNNPADNSAMFDVTSSDRGVLIPRMTQAQRNSIINPATSLLIYQTDGKTGYYYNTGTPGVPNWVALFSYNTGWALTGNTGTDALNFLGTNDAIDLIFKTNNTERLRISASGIITAGGNTVWDAGNDGTGSGLDADLLDGKHASEVVPTGTIWMFASSTIPSGWVLCDGSAIDRTVYSVLFALIGTTYGAGDGTTTFNVPDMTQRFPLGKAASGTGSTLGSTGGSIDHNHNFTPTGTVSTPSFTGNAATTANGGVDHTHTYSSTVSNPTSSNGDHSHTVDAHTHDIDPPSTIAQPWQVVQGIGNGGGISGSVDISLFQSTSSSPGTSANGNHSHTFSCTASGATNNSSTFLHSHTFTPSGTISTPNFSGNGGTTGSTNPPFIVVNYIIKY